MCNNVGLFLDKSLADEDLTVCQEMTAFVTETDLFHPKHNSTFPILDLTLATLAVATLITMIL